jgi:predicted lipoprotein with Yx(FWY)xxD motif
VSNWPVFYAANISAPQGLNASDFGTITRSDGKQQTTYKGYPLYFFIGDHKPGDINGNNVGGFKLATNK